MCIVCVCGGKGGGQGILLNPEFAVSAVLAGQRVPGIHLGPLLACIHQHVCPLHGYSGPNSSPHVRTAGIVPTEPAPRSQRVRF